MAFEAIPIEGLPMFKETDDLVGILLAQMTTNNLRFEDGDILVLAQKVVSKVEGRLVDLSTVEPSQEAIDLAAEVDKDPRLVELILRESTEVVRKKPGVLIVRHRLGLVGAHAGIDQSNIDHGEMGSALLLPKDPDASAHRIHAQLVDACQVNLGVLIADSANRPWRLGTVGIAIGAANMQVLEDRRGDTDVFERELKVTLINRADSIASAANLVMGETNEKVPAAIVRGLSNQPSTDTAALIQRPLDEDLFR